ncbi:protein kinase C-binding protein 1-like [Contarinia nasturtii]|uniref:protein kinase C-binding protein 1-like n=1 Tax=Contarinia nasturtii TaxID=265458 RepID=UPI0012D380C0|nr:protein kinase C-binding protein 1-like [Contarinia nasturtii]
MSKRDKYCWGCALPQQPSTVKMLKCDCCVRSFHVECTKEIEEEVGTEGRQNGEGDWICPLCLKLKEAKETTTRQQLDMIPVIVEQGSKNLAISSSGDDIKSGISKLVNPIYLQKIKDKVHSYKSFGEFVSEIQWLVHNYQILYPGRHNKLREANRFLTYVNAEVESIQCCFQCYKHSQIDRHHWFTMLCDEPHLLVWAYMKNFRYMPAKLMLILDGNRVTVRFFGGYHKQEDVATKNVFLYSEENPGKARTTKFQYKTALNQADTYIEAIKKKYGSFQFAQLKTVLDPTQIDRYIREMIPTIDNFRRHNAVMVPTTSNNNVGIDVKVEPQGETSSSSTRMDPCKILTVDLTEESDSGEEHQLRDQESDQSDDEPVIKRKRLDGGNGVKLPDMPSIISSASDRSIDGPINNDQINDTATELSDHSTETMNYSFNDGSTNDDLYNPMHEPSMQQNGMNEFMNDDQVNDTEPTVEDAEMTSPRTSINVSPQDTLQNASKAHLVQLNEKLEKDLKESEERRKIEIAAYEEINKNLINQIEQAKIDNSNQIEALKVVHQNELAQMKVEHEEQLRKSSKKVEEQWELKLKDDLRIANDAHRLEFNRFRKKYVQICTNLEQDVEKLNNDRRELIDKLNSDHQHAMEQVKQQYRRLIEDAKNYKYCAVCESPRKLDMFVCNVACQQHLWKNQQTSTSHEISMSQP